MITFSCNLNAKFEQLDMETAYLKNNIKHEL